MINNPRSSSLMNLRLPFGVEISDIREVSFKLKNKFVKGEGINKTCGIKFMSNTKRGISLETPHAIRYQADSIETFKKIVTVPLNSQQPKLANQFVFSAPRAHFDPKNLGVQPHAPYIQLIKKLRQPEKPNNKSQNEEGNPQYQPQTGLNFNPEQKWAPQNPSTNSKIPISGFGYLPDTSDDGKKAHIDSNTLNPQDQTFRISDLGYDKKRPYTKDQGTNPQDQTFRISDLGYDRGKNFQRKNSFMSNAQMLTMMTRDIEMLTQKVQGMRKLVNRFEENQIKSKDTEFPKFEKPYQFKTPAKAPRIKEDDLYGGRSTEASKSTSQGKNRDQGDAKAEPTNTENGPTLLFNLGQNENISRAESQYLKTKRKLDFDEMENHMAENPEILRRSNVNENSEKEKKEILYKSVSRSKIDYSGKDNI